jgi:hypothetical protein
VAPKHVIVELASHLWKRGGHGWMLDSMRELAEGVLEEGAMATRSADGYFFPEQEEASARSRNEWHTPAGDSHTTILLMKFWSKILDTFLLNHCIYKIFEGLLCVIGKL